MSKIFINVIKQRIRVFGTPEIIRDIVRNESHVRLLSSLWYIFRFLPKATILINLFFSLVYFAEEGLPKSFCGALSHGILPHGIAILFLIGAFVYLKYLIETGFHYVRLRELTMSLEGAEILRRLYAHAPIHPFDDLLKSGKDFARRNEQGCNCGFPNLCRSCEREAHRKGSAKHHPSR